MDNININLVSFTTQIDKYQIKRGIGERKNQFYILSETRNEYLYSDLTFDDSILLSGSKNEFKPDPNCGYYHSVDDAITIINLYEESLVKTKIRELDLQSVQQNALHIRNVGTNLKEVCNDLFERAIRHDESKWSKHEFPYIAEHGHKMKDVKFGTVEYNTQKELLRPMIDHHNSLNRHHPEHFGEKGINGMCLMDIIEMLADWRAAASRNKDGSLRNSITVCCEKYKISDQLKTILTNTAIQLGWL